MSLSEEERKIFEKELKLLESSILTAQANLRAAEDTHRLDMEQLELVESQIEKWTPLNPIAMGISGDF